MPALLDLANEILFQIIEETRPDDIESFTLSCKKIRTLGAKALMQHRQDLDRYISPVLGVWNNNTGRDVNPYAYLSDILLKPRRALYVNYLLVHNRGFTLTEAREEALTKKILLKVDELCGLFFRGDGCPYIKGDDNSKWVDKLRRGDTNAAACLFLTLLPRLETLCITDYSDEGYADMIYEISKANQSPQRTIPGPLALHKLETIQINDIRITDQSDVKFGVYEICMTLPSLRKLEGQHINSSFDKWPSKEEFPFESDVTEIVFHNSAISFEGFSRLFKKTKDLQCFTYGFVRMVGMVGHYDAIGLKKALEKHTAHSLTHLDLSFHGLSLDDNIRFIGSLRHLHKLKHLRVQGSMFTRWTKDLENSPRVVIVDLLQFLPASLKTLVLLPQPTDPKVEYTFENLRKNRKEYLPKLMRITCERNFPFVDGLANECARVGIELVHA